MSYSPKDLMDSILEQDEILNLDFLDSKVLKGMIRDAHMEFDDNQPISKYETYRTIQVCLDLIMNEVDASESMNLSVAIRSLVALSTRVQKYGFKDSNIYFEQALKPGCDCDTKKVRLVSVQ